MRFAFKAAMGAVILATTVALQAQDRPASPAGAAATQIDSTWIEVAYGRPLLRGRSGIFGTGADYGKTLYDDGPVWRAGANQSTRIRSDRPLVIGGTHVPAGEHVLLIELKNPQEWTLIVTAQPYQRAFDPRNTTALWGGYNYSPSHDVARAPMTVAAVPYVVDQLTWGFTDVTPAGGMLRLWWDRTMASVPFRPAT